jgi:hypothetical protein
MGISLPKKPRALPRLGKPRSWLGDGRNPSEKY